MWQAARWAYGVSGALWLVIGLLTVPLTDRRVGPPIVIISTRTDTALFGANPTDVLANNPELATLRTILVRTLAGLLVAAGLLTLSLACFALREQATWAIATMTTVGLAVLPFWWLAIAPYRAADIVVTLADMPPFMWVPGVLLPIGSVLGWVAISR